MSNMGYSVTGGGFNDGYTSFDYTVSYNSTTNKTTVTFGSGSHKYFGRAGYGSHGSTTITVRATDSGNSKSASMYNENATNGGVGTYSANPSPGSVVVDHSNTTGTKSITISASSEFFAYYDYGSYRATGSNSITITVGTYAPQSLTISPSTITAGDTVTLDVGFGTGMTFTATFSANGNVLGTHQWTGTSTTKTVPGSWFQTAGITGAGNMTVSVSITGGPNTLSGSFTVLPGGDMYPELSNLASEVVQPSSASGFSGYIAGISMAKVSATVTPKYGATLTTVNLSYGGQNVQMNYNSTTGKYEATTGTLSGNTTITVTAYDSRTLSNSASFSIVVQPYDKPTLVINEAYRCDSSGTQEDGGAYYRVRATASISPVTGNYISSLKVSTPNNVDLTNGVISSPIGGTMSENSSYTIVVVVTDALGSETMRSIRLDGARKDIIIKHNLSGIHLGIGMIPELNYGRATLEMPANSGILIGGYNIANPVNYVCDHSGEIITSNGTARGYGTYDIVRIGPRDVMIIFAAKVTVAGSSSVTNCGLSADVIGGTLRKTVDIRDAGYWRCDRADGNRVDYGYAPRIVHYYGDRIWRFGRVTGTNGAWQAMAENDANGLGLVGNYISGITFGHITD